MRQIGSEEIRNRKKKRNTIFVGSILIFLMVFSIVGFAFIGHGFGGGSVGNSGENSSGTTQGGDFYNGQYWVVNRGGQQFYFTNSFEETSDVPVDTNLTLQKIAGNVLFIDSKDTTILNELSLNLGRYAQRLQPACYGHCKEDIPEKLCDEQMIVWVESENNKVYQEDKCVFIEGDTLAVDAFLYKILGVN